MGTFHLRYCSLYEVHGQVGNLILVEHNSDEKKLGYRGPNADVCQNLCLANPAKKSLTKFPSPPAAKKAIHNRFERTEVQLIAGESLESLKVFIVTENWYKEPLYHSDSVHSRGGRGGRRGLTRRRGLDAELDARRRSHRSSYRGFLYDSVLDSWTVIGTWEEKSDNKDIACRIVFHEGEMDCILCDYLNCGFSTESINYRFCRYDGQNSCWQELSAQIPAEKPFGLLEWQGRLLIAGGEYGTLDDGPRFASIQIWQLDEKKFTWEKSIEMPNHLLNTFCLPEILDQSIPMGSFPVEPYESVKLCGHYLGWTSKCSDHSAYEHVICDMSRNVWWNVPEPELVFQAKARARARARTSARVRVGVRIRARSRDRERTTSIV